MTIEVTNTGGAGGTYTVKLLVDGRVEATKAVALAPGETKVVAFTVVRTEPGAYSVEVDGLRDEFVVEEVPAAPS